MPKKKREDKGEKVKEQKEKKHEKPQKRFTVKVSGQLEIGELPGCKDVYCRVIGTAGDHWEVLKGADDSVTQVSRCNSNEVFVWNFPFEVTYKSTSPSGWPQIIICAYGPDMFGRDVIRGYGLTHVPVLPQSCQKTVGMFVPNTSTWKKLTAFLTGQRPELIDPKCLATIENRDGFFVETRGRVRLSFNVIVKGMLELGYDSGSIGETND